MKRQPIGTGSRGEGTWKLSKDGFCTIWKGGKDSCFTVVSRRRQQMVGAQGLDHHGDLEQITGAPVARGRTAHLPPAWRAACLNA